MNKIRVSCAQFRPEIGNVAFNLEKIASLFHEFKDLKSNVFVFPEQCVQGLTSPEETESTAETIPGNSSAVICELSKKYAVYSIVGMAETVISAELDLQVADDLRELVPVLRDRQKQTYRDILH